MSASLAEILAAVEADCAGPFAQMDWAEEEIDKAAAAHPAQADWLHHAFTLICPTWPDRASAEFVLRGHAREILARVAAGADTRPATYAEICIVCCESSALAPLTAAGAGLYFRAWRAAFPETMIAATDQVEHYEALRGSQIDDLEAAVRAKFARPRRVLDPAAGECSGRHAGEPAPGCPFIPAPVPEPAQAGLW